MILPTLRGSKIHHMFVLSPLCLLLLLCACRQEPEFTPPDMVEENVVRPDVVTQPAPVVTNATNNLDQ